MYSYRLSLLPALVVRFFFVKFLIFANQGSDLNSHFLDIYEIESLLMFIIHLDFLSLGNV